MKAVHTLLENDYHILVLIPAEIIASDFRLTTSSMFSPLKETHQRQQDLSEEYHLQLQRPIVT